MDRQIPRQLEHFSDPGTSRAADYVKSSWWVFVGVVCRSKYVLDITNGHVSFSTGFGLFVPGKSYMIDTVCNVLWKLVYGMVSLVLPE